MTAAVPVEGAAPADRRVLRGEHAAGAGALSTPQLRTGAWTRFGGERTLGDPVTEDVLSALAETTRTASGRGTDPSLLDALKPVTFNDASPTSGANDSTSATAPPVSTPKALGVVVMTFTSESTDTWAMALPLNTLRCTVLPSSKPVTPGTMPAPRRTATRGATARPTWL